MSGFTGKESRVLFFWAEWHEPSKVGMWQLVDALQAKYPSIHFEHLEAEKETEMSLKFKVKVVPTFVALLEGEKVFERVEGVNPQEVSSMVKRLSEAAAQLHSSSAFMQSIGATLPSEASSSLPEELTERLKRLIFSAPVMVFMKGSPSAPRCGFSRQTADLLQSQGISFGSFDILNDEEVREGLKKYSDWPTFPQVYAHGELIGGLVFILLAGLNSNSCHFLSNLIRIF